MAQVDDEAVTVLRTMGGLEPMGAAAMPWVSHVAHNGAHMACDLLLGRGRCTIGEWSLGFTQQALLADTLCSDHRPLVAHVTVDAPGGAAKGTDEAISMT